MEELKEIEEYLRGIDPFDIPLDKYRRIMNDERYSSLANQILVKLDELYGDWIREKFRETKAQSIVVCDRKVVFYSKNRYEPSDGEVRKMEEKMGKPCYVITGEPLIEERSNWSFLSESDYYPTVEIYLGRIDWSDDDVFEKGIKVRSDFDTGNPEYTVLDEKTCRRMESEIPLRRVGYHLGRRYFYFPRMMKVGITDRRRNRCLSKIVEGVDNWNNVELNPYRLANPNREGFIGRDLMLKLLFRITLDPGLRRSTWELL
jgi:hypothetical protein